PTPLPRRKRGQRCRIPKNTSRTRDARNDGTAHVKRSEGVCMKPIGHLLLISILAFAPAMAAERADAPATHPPGVAVASAHELATEAGLEILREGGNAFDAAVAVSSTLSVDEPISSGLGGGGFFLLRDGWPGAGASVQGGGTTPARATAVANPLDNGAFHRARAMNGPRSAGIPGLPAALVYLSEQYGKLPLQKSLAPAIR